MDAYERAAGASSLHHGPGLLCFQNLISTGKASASLSDRHKAIFNCHKNQKNQSKVRTYPLQQDDVPFLELLTCQWVHHVFLDKLLNTLHCDHMTSALKKDILKCLLQSKMDDLVTLVSTLRKGQSCWAHLLWRGTCTEPGGWWWTFPSHHSGQE